MGGRATLLLVFLTCLAPSSASMPTPTKTPSNAVPSFIITRPSALIALTQPSSHMQRAAPRRRYVSPEATTCSSSSHPLPPPPPARTAASSPQYTLAQPPRHPSTATPAYVYTAGAAPMAGRSTTTAHRLSRAWRQLQLVRGGASVAPTNRLSKARAFVLKNFLVIGMVVAIVGAAVNPAFGRVGGPLRPELTVNLIGVSVIFLLSGLSLPLKELTSAMANVRLNAAVQGFNLGAVPLLGLALQQLLKATGLDVRLCQGLLIVSCLPTTINMSIVLSQASGGSLATAVFNTVLSNGLGVFVTPALIFSLLGTASVALPYLAVITRLFYKVVLPVAAGVVLRSYAPIRRKLEKPSSKVPLKLTTESILIAIIYTTFCDSFRRGIAVRGTDLLVLGAVVPTFHLLLLACMFVVAGAVGASRQQQVAAMFVGSHKSLAVGMPLIKTIFESHPSLALFSAPLLLLHPSQLVLGSLLAPSFARYTSQQQQQQQKNGMRW